MQARPLQHAARAPYMVLDATMWSPELQRDSRTQLMAAMPAQHSSQGDRLAC